MQHDRRLGCCKHPLYGVEVAYVADRVIDVGRDIRHLEQSLTNRSQRQAEHLGVEPVQQHRHPGSLEASMSR